MRKLVATVALAVLAASCASGTEPTIGTSRTTAAAPETTFLKLPPVDETLTETEAEYVQSLRLWSIQQSETTAIDQIRDQQIAGFGRGLCTGIDTITDAGLSGEAIIDYHGLLTTEMEEAGYDTDSVTSLFARAIFILCPEHQEAVDEAFADD
jgi:hypothetical protein